MKYFGRCFFLYLCWFSPKSDKLVQVILGLSWKMSAYSKTRFSNISDKVLTSFLMDAVFGLARPEISAVLGALGTLCWRSLSDALQEPEDVVVPAGQRRAWCWCMCFGLAFMLAGVILGGAYLYKYFAFQVSGVHLVMGGLRVFLRYASCLEEESLTKPNSLPGPLLYLSKISGFLKACSVSRGR